MQRISFKTLLVVVLVLFNYQLYAQSSTNNIAYGANAFASTELSPAASAVDGNLNTRWESEHGPGIQWLALDFGKAYEITDVEINWEAANPARYEIQGSNDNSSWQTLVSKTDGVFGNRIDKITVTGEFRYLRVYALERSEGNQWGYSIFEIKVFGFIKGEEEIIPVSANASSEFQSAQNAIDGNPATRWESNHGIEQSWIVFDLGTEQNLSRIVIDWEAANASTYTIQGSNDNNTWTILTAKEDGVFGDRRDELDLNGKYRYIRINCIKRSDGNLWGYSIWGVRIYALSTSQTYEPLYDESTILEPDTVIDTPQALITRFADRVRDRHAREAQFSAYDHYLPFYWIHRSAEIEIIDEIAKGGSKIRVNVKTQWPLNVTDFRAFFRGINTVAEYFHNVGLQRDPNDPLLYHTILEYNPKEGRPIQIGDRMEIELSQFLDNPPEGRENYYGTAFLYIVGKGLVPWEARGSLLDSFPIASQARLGGDTTVHRQYSDEPQEFLKQMVTNMAPHNAQNFLQGRRVHFTNFDNGQHSEPDNPQFSELKGKLGKDYVNSSCVACHINNGRALPPPTGQILTSYEVRVSDDSGNPHPEYGRVIQTQSLSGSPMGSVKISSWEEQNGLRKPVLEFAPVEPEHFSPRIAPQLVGLGLLEAISESDIEALANLSENPGRIHIVKDIETGVNRVGRFGYKAQGVSLRQFIADTLHTSMGVTSSLFPAPDCGDEDDDCETRPPLEDEYLEVLVKYNALLGVRAQRNESDAVVLKGKEIFSDIGCAICHHPTFKTSSHHPYAELRNQIIHPYTDLLLHDMGPGLADTIVDGDARGSEWRTAPLWNIGLTKDVTKGEAYLHDGRAKSLHEAILWHQGQGQDSKQAYENLSEELKNALIKFLESL